MQLFDHSLARLDPPSPPSIALYERHRGRLRGAPPQSDSPEGRLEVIFVFAGAGALVGGAEPQALRPGDLVLNPAHLHYSLEDSAGNPLGLYNLRIPRGIVARAQVDPQKLPHGRYSLTDSGTGYISLCLRRMLFAQSVAHSNRDQLEVLTLRLLRDLTALAHGQPLQPELAARGSATGLERMHVYVDNLAHSFFEESTIDAAAKSLVLSRRRFTQLFREVTQTTWLAYLRQLRIAHACSLLAHTRRTVNSVAFECGFEDLSTFYRAFKRESRTSPNRWRQEQAAG